MNDFQNQTNPLARSIIRLHIMGSGFCLTPYVRFHGDCCCASAFGQS
jgi:hypothetical protein